MNEQSFSFSHCLKFHVLLKITSFILLTGKRAAVLVAKGAVDIILRVIVNTSKEASVCEEILLLSHVILTKVGPKGMFLPIQNDTFNMCYVEISYTDINAYLVYVGEILLCHLKIYDLNCSRS